MQVGLLGPLTIDGHDARLGRRDRVVLTALALRTGAAVSNDQLADAVWGEVPPISAKKNLQSCVMRLRKLLGPTSIETSPHGYRLTLPVDAVDAERFERMVVRGRELLALGEAERAAFVLAEALQSWRGSPFIDLEGWDQREVEVSRLDGLRLDAEEVRVDALLQAGHHADVLTVARTLVHLAPFRERRWTLLAVAQYRSGQQGEALRTIHDAKVLFAQELGLDVGPELSELERAILRQDKALMVAGAMPAPARRCPYQGLLPYDVDDADFFFGRDDELRAGLEILRRTSVLVVVGASGCGKSSLVRAGVAASLRRAGSPAVVITPGRRPVLALPARCRDGPWPALVVDQCEEAFSLCDDPAERADFLLALVQHATRAPLVVALRGDHLSDVSAYPVFARLAEHGLLLLGAPDEDALREAVEAPAHQSGLRIEPGLTDLLLREVRDEPGGLPLLSHALQETWKRREGLTLTATGYSASGGIRNAVAQSAERVYAATDPAQRPLLRDVVLRLVSLDPGGAPVRSRLPRRLLVSEPAQDRLIDRLVAARLVTSDSDTVEIAHESLVVAWPRLRAWLDDDVEGQRIRCHLTSAADAWDSLGRPDSELYRGVRLDRALAWQGHERSVLTPVEEAFLEASARRAADEDASAETRARQQATLIRRLRVVLAGAAVLLVASLVAGLLAVQQAGRAGENAAAAVASQTSAEARRVGSLALATDDLDESMLLAVAGVRMDDSPETRGNLQTNLARHPELIASTQLTGLPVIHLDVSPDGRTVATYDNANRVRLYEIATGELVADYRAGTERRRSWQAGQVAFSPDGQTIAVLRAAPTRHPVALLDAASLEPVPAQPGGVANRRWQATDLTFSQDGRHLASVLQRVRGTGNSLTATTASAVVWDLEQPEGPSSLIPMEGYPGVALSPDGQVLVTTQGLVLHDLGADTSTPVAGGEPAERIVTSPDGRLLAASAGPAGLVLLDARTGELLRRLPGNDDSGWFVRFSVDGRRVATVTLEKQEALVWDVASGAKLAQLPLGESGESFDFSPDGSTLYTAGSGSALRHWDLDGGRRFMPQVAAGKPGPIEYLGFTQPAPGGELVALPSESRVAFFDVARATTVSLERGRGHAPRRGSWHPDGVHYALATGGEVRVWDASEGDLVRASRPAGKHVTGLDHSTDGSRLVIAELSGRVTMLDAETLEPVGAAAHLDEPVCCVAAGPDNRTAIALTGPLDASGFWSDSTTGWATVDLESGTVLDRGELELNARHVDFSPDGRHAALAGQAGEVMVLDLASGSPLRRPVVVADDSLMMVTYSADGQRIVASGADSSVALVDAGTGLLVARARTPNALNTAGFLHDSTSVLIAPHGDGPVYLWNADGDHAVAFACRVAGRDLTEEEWAGHFGSRPYRTTCPGQD